MTAAKLAESSRVEAFSDGVLAIAITLLVLDLNVPAHEPGKLLHELGGLWPTYLAYLASFFYIGVIWVNHHALFTRIAWVDGGLLWRNLLLLLMVSVFPFPTATLADAIRDGSEGDQLAAIALYGVTAMGMGVSWLLMFGYLQRHPALVADHVEPGFFGNEKRRAALGIASPLLAVAIGAFLPEIALGAFLLLAIFYGVTSQGWTAPATRS